MPLHHFDNEKQQALRKLATIDKSKKGSLDKLIVPILALLNEHPDYYTTSSCSGRIMVLAVTASRRKDHAEWFYTTHEPSSVKDVVKALINTSLPSEKTSKRGEGVWLKQESAILHVACRDLVSAEILLEIVRSAGFKRAGIIATRRRVMLEIIGTDAVAIPLGTGKKILVTRSYISFAVSICNDRLKANQRKLEALSKALSTLSKTTR